MPGSRISADTDSRSKKQRTAHKQKQKVNSLNHSRYVDQASLIYILTTCHSASLAEEVTWVPLPPAVLNSTRSMTRTKTVCYNGVHTHTPCHSNPRLPVPQNNNFLCAPFGGSLCGNPFFPQQRKLGVFSHCKSSGAGRSSQIRWEPGWPEGSQEEFPFTSGSLGAAKSVWRKVGNWVPRKRFPSKVSQQGSQQEVPKQGFPARGSQARFPGTGSQARVPIARGSKAKSEEAPSKRFPSKVPRKRFQAGCPSKVARQGYQEQIPKQGFPGTSSQARFPGTGCQEQVPKQGLLARGFRPRFPSKVPRRFPSKVPGKVTRNRPTSKVPRNKFPSKGS